MDPKLVHIIEQTGLSEKHAKVYLAALELGGASVSDIAKKAEVERVNTYYILNQLAYDGLVSLSQKGNTKVYIAVSPKNLLVRARSTLKFLETKMPELLSIENTDKSRPIIQFFEGKEGLAQILQDMINAMKDKPEPERLILEYVSPDSGIQALREPQLAFIEARIKHKIRLRWIAPDTPLAREYLKTAPKSYREMRLVPQDKFPLLTEMNIYGNKMNLLGEKGALIGVIIEQPDIAQTQKEIFELAWLGAEKFNSPKD